MKAKEPCQAKKLFSTGFVMLLCCLLLGCVDLVPAAQRIEAASKSLATQLALNLPVNKKLRVAVMPSIDYTGQAGGLIHSLGESLKSALVRSTHFDIIEDGDMQKVMHQLHIQEQGRGLLDESTIQRMGKMLAAEAILVGTITDLNDDFGVNFRIVPIESGVVASAGTVTIRKANFVRSRIITYPPGTFFRTSENR